MSKPHFEAWCYRCDGGGKSLGMHTSSKAAWRAAAQHQNVFGHPVGVVDRRAKKETPQ